MLFPSEALLKERERLIRAMGRGKLTMEQGYRRLMEIDPQDFASMGALAVRLIAAGDTSGAEALLWRAIENNPLNWIAYFETIPAVEFRKRSAERGPARIGVSKDSDG